MGGSTIQVVVLKWITVVNLQYFCPVYIPPRGDVLAIYDIL